MVISLTCGVCPAHTRTRVNTVLVHTSLVSGALIIGDTLWLTLNIWIPYIVPDTFA